MSRPSNKKAYQGASRSYDEIKTIRVSVMGDILHRGLIGFSTSLVDQNYVNGYFEVFKNAESNKTHYYFRKRPGQSLALQVTSSGVGRGVHSWNGKRYSVVGTKIYSETTDLGVTLTTSTGMVGFAETRPGAGTQYLCINDGIKLYCIATNDVVTTVTINFPTPNTSDLIYMDGYLFVMKSNGIIYNCNLDDPTTWYTANFITTQQYDGSAIGLSHQNNILLAFTDRAIAAFYDAGNASGSPLSLYEQAVQNIGCFQQSTIASADNYTFWVSQNPATGGFSAMKMEGLGVPKAVSTPAIDRFLESAAPTAAAAGTQIVGFCLKISGKFFYLIRGSGLTYVYDIKEDLWVIWASWKTVAGLTFESDWVISSVYQDSTSSTAYSILGQHATDGALYYISSYFTTENNLTGPTFRVKWRTDRLDFDTMLRKYVKQLDLIGDSLVTGTEPTSNTLFTYYDDDYITPSTARTLDMLKTRPFCSNLGNFRRRAFVFSYEGSNAWRVQGFEIRLRVVQ